MINRDFDFYTVYILHFFLCSMRWVVLYSFFQYIHLFVSEKKLFKWFIKFNRLSHLLYVNKKIFLKSHIFIRFWLSQCSSYRRSYKTVHDICWSKKKIKKKKHSNILFFHYYQNSDIWSRYISLLNRRRTVLTNS